MNTSELKDRLSRLDSVFSPGDDYCEKRVGKALVLDLSDEAFYEWSIPTQFLESYVSGPALGARLWAEFAGSGVEDPSTYESENPVVITGSFVTNSGMPGGESVSIAFRSPVSGNLSFNVVSNTVGMRLAAIGYVAMIITGRLRRPAVIDVRKSGVTYNVSEVYIGYTVSQMEELVGVNPMTTAMSIGPAGEQKVPYAAVVCEGMTTGRGGLGCVFGFKNIKSLCITGFCTDFVRSGDEAEIERTFTRICETMRTSPYVKNLQKSGTSCFVKSSGKYGWAPVFNFSRRTDPRLFHLGGDEVSRRYGKEHSGCIACPVLCRHRTADGVVIPGYESILMLGSNIGCFDMDRIIERYCQCIDFGLDPVSTGNVLGWLYQACQKGNLPFLGEDFSFRDNSKVLALIELIARRTGSGEILSYGTFALGKACEDDSFAYTIRGLECGPFDYRGAYAQCVSDIMGFWMDNYFEIHSSLCKRSHADWAVLNERLVMGLESFGISPALIVPTVIEPHKKLKKIAAIIPNKVMNALKPKIIAESLSAVTGRSIEASDILTLGDRTWRLIYEIDRSLGFDMLNDSGNLLAEHFSIDPDSNHNDLSIVPCRSLLERYCFLRKQTIVLQGSDFQ